MSFLYYTIYLFSVRIMHLQKQQSPVISITALMSLLMSFLIYSIIDLFLPKYSSLILFAFCIILYELLYKYYKTREKQLIKKINKKPLWQKIIIVIISILFIILVIYLCAFDGNLLLLQFLQKSCLDS